MLSKVYVLLPVHNRLEQTTRFVVSLLKQTYSNYYLILIDDGSTDRTSEYVKSNVPALTVITGKGNWWWGGGLHQGYLWLKKSRAGADDIVLMINNDTEFGPDFLQVAVDSLSHQSKTLLLASVYGKVSGKLVEAGVHVDWQRLAFEHTEDPAQVNCLSTRGLFIRVGDLLSIGGFHPWAVPHYLSDYEFTIRAHCKGYCLKTDVALSLIVDEVATGYHKWHRADSRIDFFKKYFSKKSSTNPVYWFFFVALACPWPWKLLNFVRVIYGGFATVCRKTFGIYNCKWE